MSEKQTSVSRLSVTDWTGQKRAEISGDMEPNTTRLSEITRKAVEALDLPQNTPYSLFRHAPDGRDDEKLNQTDTIQQAKLENDSNLMIAPEVSAG
ncbi:hypothetical protein JXQ31_02705 [candidate division KSB1 bacterium]|nr:hypothetical protein [candidate division KSB1 bacterium]